MTELGVVTISFIYCRSHIRCMKLTQDILRREIFDTRNDKEFDELLKIKGDVFNVHIKANSYNFQSSATIKMWSDVDNKWNVVSSIPYPKMNSYKYEHKFKEDKSSYEIKAFDDECAKLFESEYDYHECAFQLDRNRLVDDAKIIVFSA